MTRTPNQLADSYFDAWKAGDLDTLRSILADDVEFSGPLANLKGRDDVVAGLVRLAEITSDIVIHKRFADGPDVLTWFDLHTRIAPPAPVANWSHTDDGRITRIRVTFDPRPILEGGGQPGTRR